MNYTYLLRCADGTLYTGWTNDLEKRLQSHNAGAGAKYTKTRLPVSLAYYELHETKGEAMRREAQIKRLSRAQKLTLLERGTEPLRLTAKDSSVTVFVPPQQTKTAVYLLSHDDEAAAVFSLLKAPKPVLIAVGGADWEAAFTPWPSENIRRGQPPFKGQAEPYLRFLTETLIPETEQRLSLTVATRCLCGYSLAGLFAAWALFQTDCFSRVASVSGSLWYDGFAAFAASNALRGTPERVYFSLGEREKLTKNRRMATIERQTLAVCESLKEKGLVPIFEHNPGGHFDEPALRLARAIDRLCEERGENA